MGSGYYKIENVAGNKALDVKDNSLVNGGVLQVWAYGGGNNQQWQLNQVETNARMMAPGMEETTGNEVVSMSIFPNPAADKITLVTQEAGTYTIIGLTGNTISTGDVVKGENAIDINGLASGYYMVKFDNGMGGTQTLKLIKE